jgi:ribulose-phosphate 3-epimerase
VESKGDIAGLLQHIQRQGCKAGLTLRPKTPVETLIPYLPLLDVVLVMTVEPGFGGQSFMKEQVLKISELRKRIEKNKFKALIEVDGGVNGETVQFLQDCDVMVAGNFVFKGEYAHNIAILKGET